MKWHKGIFSLFITLIAISCARAPSVEFSPDKIEMGVLLPGEIIEDTIWVKNTGSGYLEAMARSGCDCIELENSLPDSISPGDSAALAFVYYAPDSVGEDKVSILFSTNDSRRKTAKVEISAQVKRRRLARGDSTITVIPTYIQSEELKPIAQKSVQKFFDQLGSKLKFHGISPITISQHIANDPQLKKLPIENTIRKWALVDSIRWVIAFQIFKQGNSIKYNCLIVDGFSEFPIVKVFTAEEEQAPDSFANELISIFENYGSEHKDAIMKGMQRKWARQRSQVIGKPLPKMHLIDVLSGDTITADNAAGSVLVMHFFSIDCEHCEEEIEWMTDLVKSHSGRPGFTVWGVSVDIGELEKVREFAQKRSLPYPILLPTSESNRRLTRIYGGATPQTIIVNKKGNVADFFVGFNEVLTKRLENTIEKLVK